MYSTIARYWVNHFSYCSLLNKSLLEMLNADQKNMQSCIVEELN